MRTNNTTQTKVLFSHSPGILANKRAAQSTRARETATQKLNDLTLHRSTIINQSTAKIVTNIFLTVLAIGLIFPNVLLDAPAFQNIFDFQGNMAPMSYFIALGLVLTGVLFGCLLEEALDPHLTVKVKSNSAVDDSNIVFGKNQVNYKRWIYGIIGLVGITALGFAIYKLNEARFEMMNNLNTSGVSIEKHVIIMPILLYVAEAIASIGIIPTSIFTRNHMITKSMMSSVSRYTKIAHDKSVEAIELWKSYIIDLDRHNSQHRAEEKALPPNRYLRDLIRLEDASYEADTNENHKQDDSRNVEVEDEDFEFEDMTNKPF
ncbi:MAG: hypothetical protein K8S00_06050 [Bacteroidales bacterium]|nr:hypothetical protein [Bacteroidales bacterium]